MKSKQNNPHPKIFIIIIFLALVIKSLTAQNSTKGTEFWVAFMDNVDLGPNGQPKFSFLISSDVNTSGTISFPVTGFSINFTAAAGQVTEVFLPAGTFYPIGSEFIDNKGIKVTSNDPINLTVHHHRLYFSEASVVLPVSELGDYYMIMAHDDYYDYQPSEFIVAATEDSSIIEITPSALTMGLKPPGITFSVKLNKGEVYQVQAMGDLTGTTVKTENGKKIAVFSGAKRAHVFCYYADDHLYDQNYPVSKWGTEYIITTFPVYTIVDTGGTFIYGGDIIRILSAVNQTEVYFNCSTQIKLNQGEYFDTLLYSPVKITSTKPITVGQFKRSQDCSGLGDPTFLLYSPVSYYSTKTVFNSLISAITGNEFTNHYVNIVVHSTDTNLILLDGNNISDSFAPIPSVPYYSCAVVSLNSGTHILESDSGFYAFAYGFKHYDAYSYFLGYEGTRIIRNMQIDLGNDNTICKGDSVKIGQPQIDGYLYKWSIANGLNENDTSFAQPYVKPENTTIYYLFVEDTAINDCNNTAMDSIKIIVQDCNSDTLEPPFVSPKPNNIFIPSIFSPNGDEKNDVLYVRGNNIAELYFSIYNRWGEKIFETTDKTIGWDGTYKGKLMNAAVFVYYAKIIFEDGNMKELKGNVTLIK